MTQLEACRDAVIAIAITLLVLDVKVPAVKPDLPGAHTLLIRRSIRTGEPAFNRCYTQTSVPLATLVRVAGRPWTVEESSIQSSRTQRHVHQLPTLISVSPRLASPSSDTPSRRHVQATGLRGQTSDRATGSPGRAKAAAWQEHRLGGRDAIGSSGVHESKPELRSIHRTIRGARAANGRQHPASPGQSDLSHRRAGGVAVVVDNVRCRRPVR
jgi:Endosomal/lysosomal potassium channel TMEM175